MDNKNVSLSAGEKLGLISNLHTMLAAGIPILDTVHSILEDAKGNQKKILETLAEDVSQGKAVNISFAKFPKVFDKVTINVIKASEEAGTLDVTLLDLKDTIKKQNEFNDRVRSALLYPFFIIGVFVLVLLVNLIFVIPKVAMVFRDLRVPLPAPTKVLIFVSDLMLKETIPFIIAAVLIAIGSYFIFTRKKSLILNILYSLPLISELIKLIDLTRFTRSLHLLLASGLPITEALELTKDVISRKTTAKVIENSREMVLTGKPFSAGLRTGKGYVPGIMIKLVEAGEKTGTLDQSLQDISEYFDNQVSNTLVLLTTLLEPILLVSVGIVVGIMMLSIIAPIYGLISQISATAAK